MLFVGFVHYFVCVIMIVITIYMVRQYSFTVNRLFGRQRHPYIDIETADWPKVSILVAAHNEEAVIEHSLNALLNVIYPADKLQIIIANDRSTDATKEILDEFSERYPGRFLAFHRTEGKPGKAAALKDATKYATGEILIIFDADYIPGRGLIKQLTTAFFDPEIGLVMGRVVPYNTDYNLLTRLIDLERSAGYQVGQQARMNMQMVPQYGGTVGGVRKSMLESIGGWRDDVLAEDTDLTYRALLKGWKTAYHNHSECYEEAPQTWPARIKQIMRWGKGHNQVMFEQYGKVIMSGEVSLAQWLDGLLLLAVYILSPIVMIAWFMLVAVFYKLGLHPLHEFWPVLSLIIYGASGNFVAYFEIAAAVYLDGGRKRILLLPLNFMNFIVSLVAISRTTFNQLIGDRFRGGGLKWDKTPRFRRRG